MRRRSGVIVAGALVVGIALSACGGSSATLTAEDVPSRLADAGIACRQVATEPVQDGIVARSVTCVVGETGTIAVAVANSPDDFAAITTPLCEQAAGQSDLPDIAYGNNWLAVVGVQGSVVDAQRVAEALGGTAGSVSDLCSE